MASNSDCSESNGNSSATQLGSSAQDVEMHTVVPLSHRRIDDEATTTNRRHDQNNQINQTPLAPKEIKIALDSKIKQHYLTWLLCFLTIITLGISIWLIFVTFIRRLPLPSYLRLSQGHTVYLVQVSTILNAYLVQQLVNTTFEALRWSITARVNGVSILSFLAMGRATGLLEVVNLLRVPGWHMIWCAQRIIYKALCYSLNFFLLSNVIYTTIYIPDYSTVLAVTAGLAPLNGFSPVPPSLIDIYFIMFMENILRDTTTVTGITPISCTGSECYSIYLPGGISLVRRNSSMESSLFGDQLPQGSAIQIDNAPGYQLDFFPIEDETAFNLTNDCVTYGDTNKEAIHMCVAADGDKILAGWSVCPTTLSLSGLCFKNTDWTNRLDQSTVLMLHKRYSTVIFDRSNLSIISVASISEPIPPTELSTMEAVKNLTHIFNIIFQPVPSILNTSDPNFPTYNTAYSAQYILGWVLRLYQDDFRNYPGGPIAVLQGFLTVPFQFSTTAWQWASFGTLPSDLKTTALLVSPEQRALGNLWTLKVFAAVAGVLILWAVTILTWVFIWGPNCPNLSNWPEIDILAKASIARTGGRIETTDDHISNLEFMARQGGMGNGTSKEVRAYFKGKRLFVGAVDGRIGLTTKEKQLESLQVGQLYS